MERFRSILPWIVIWLPAAAVVVVFGIVGAIRLLYAKPPTFPSLVGSIPQTSLAVVEEKETQPRQYVYDTAKKTPFIVDVTVEAAKIPESAQHPKERIRLTGVFVVNGNKMCLINGTSYREGNNIYQRGTVAHIGLDNVIIRVNNEEKTLLVGQEAEI
ncbi:MAG: hypothetical protein WHS38_03295 [Thermodesulforhabdaceae bacterium]|jgi:hypothetical protein